MIKETDDLLLVNNISEHKITKNVFNHILVYEENNIAGFIDYSKMYEKIEINYVFVLKNQRNKKIGFKLLKYIIDNNDFENITLEVSVDNIYAIKLYKSLGFKIINKREKYYNNVDAYLMEVKK